MKEATQKITIGIWKLFKTYGPEIAPGLAGTFHEFMYKGYAIAVLKFVNQCENEV